jgi:AraC-like DNA-binding protein
MLTFKQTDWHELWQQETQASSVDSEVDEFEEYWQTPACLGRGYSRSVDLSPGIWLDWSVREYHQDLLVKVPAHDHLVQSFVLVSGEVADGTRYPTLGEPRSYLSGSGISPSYTERYRRSQPLAWVNIHLLPEVFTDFFWGLAGANDALLKVLVKQEEWKVSFFPTVTPTLRQTAQQIIHSPLSGTMRRLYLQEKVFELLTLQLQPILKDQRLCYPQPGHKPDTIARIYHAQEILHSCLEQPPALLDLARQVGVSDRTLRRGFRELFGTTVVGYLMQQRMQQAELLLRENACTVAEVANQVGYAHLGHFAAGFKRQFGMTPSQCLAGQQGAEC